MASSIFGPRQGGNSILSAFRSPRDAFQFFADSGSKCTLPNGQQLTIQELADMTRGKTPDQVFRENGLDYQREIDRFR